MDLLHRWDWRTEWAGPLPANCNRACPIDLGRGFPPSTAPGRAHASASPRVVLMRLGQRRTADTRWNVRCPPAVQGRRSCRGVAEHRAEQHGAPDDPRRQDDEETSEAGHGCVAPSVRPLGTQVRRAHMGGRRTVGASRPPSDATGRHPSVLSARMALGSSPRSSSRPLCWSALWPATTRPVEPGAAQSGETTLFMSRRPRSWNPALR
jgi:hypothetical protein